MIHAPRLRTGLALIALVLLALGVGRARGRRSGRVGTRGGTLRGDDARTSLAVGARDEDGNEILDAILVIDGKAYRETAYEDESGKRHLVVVRGISPGPHRIAVAARNHRTRLYRIVLKEGERRTITARLRPCPPDE